MRNCFLALHFFRGLPSTIVIALVTDNEHPTQQKCLIFRPQKPPFRCKIGPQLYIELRNRTQIFPLIRVVDTVATPHPKMRTNHFVLLKSFRLPTIVLAAVLLLAPGAQAQFYEWSAGALQCIAVPQWLRGHGGAHMLEK